MKVLIIGGTGFVGKELTQELLSNGYQVVILTRNKAKVREEFTKEVELIEFGADQTIPPSKQLEDVEYVVNLAGESIANGRWTKNKKDNILNSRVNTTRAIVDAIEEKVIKPKSLINASAVGYYGPREDEEITEVDKVGEDFLAEVCKQWELEAYKAQSFGVRVATLRIGVVLGKSGALQQMLTPFKLFLGGPVGSGNQWLSWIHINDLVSMIRFIIESEAINGPINAVAPSPLKMKEFSKAIGKEINRPAKIRVPSAVLQLVLGEMSDMLINGQRVLPRKILDEGFEYKFPTVEKALENIL